MVASRQHCTAGSHGTKPGQEEVEYAARTLMEGQLAAETDHAAVDLQIAPNPVMHESTVRYYLPRSSAIVSLSLLDVNGREVRRLVQPGQQTGGRRARKLPAEGRPAGMYIGL